MIISHTHKFVYIGIPRTGSKSMNHWLTEHFDGKWCAGHHSVDVPPEGKDYLIFTMVRNPYNRAFSGMCAVTWDELNPSNKEIGPCANDAERMRKQRAILAARPQVKVTRPCLGNASLEEQLADAEKRNESIGGQMNQARFIKHAGVKLALYFERLPECLVALPFVDPANIPDFPHHPERGIKPGGDFFSWSSADGEQALWHYAEEVFSLLDYQRHQLGLPDDAPAARWL